MAEGNWNQPDPSGPAWASQTDYYMGAAEALRRMEGQPAQPPPPVNVRQLRRYRFGRKTIGIVFAVLAVWCVIGSINYAVTGQRGYLVAGVIFTAIFGLLARWALRSARELRVQIAEAEGRASAAQAPVAR